MKSKSNKKMEESAYKQKRLVLSSISRKMRKLREIYTEQAESTQESLYWQSRTINQMLMIKLYNKNNDQEFRTFWQWKKEGKTIRKGAKAVVIWGQKTEAHKAPEKPEDNPEDFEFFPICYLFSSKDIIDKSEKSQEHKNELIEATFVM